MERLTKEQRQEVLEQIRSMPSGYSPEDVARELGHDWQMGDAREAFALAHEAGIPGW